MSIISENKQFISDLQEEKLSLSESFTRSLDLLATGLFTRQGQFFYELIQNAEDCTREGEETTIEIVLRPDAVIFRNNGDLFDKEDIRNLCDVGRTQKKTNDENIGFWGIGFKSVFRVTDAPHVFSNKFHFKFDREHWQNDGIDEDLDEIPWRVTPIWMSEPPIEPSDDWNIFYLPYIDGEYKDRVLDGVEQLEDRLLLFLEQIGEIRIIDELEDETDRSRQMAVSSRTPSHGGRLVELSSGKKWWVYEETFPVPPEVSNDKVTRERKREDIDKRPARIALKVNDEGNLVHLSEGSIHASVFSFLPIQGITSGMPFMIDADLLTGAGRTKPHEDAAWNNWMMEEIGSTLIPNVIGQLKDHDTWKYQFQNAILPSERPGSQLFRRLDDAIMESARSSEMIPTADGGWVTPDNAIHPVGGQSNQIRELLVPDDVTKLTKRELTHENLSLLKRLLGARLAIRQLGTNPEDLPDSGTNLAELATNQDWLSSKEKSEDEEWFCLFYELLADTRGFDDDLRESLVAYTDGGLKFPEDVYLSFPDEIGEVIKQINAEDVFPTIPDSILKSDEAKDFLERLDIEEVSANDLAEDLVEYPEMLRAMAAEDHVDNWFRDLYVVLSRSGRTEDLRETPIVYTGSTVVKPSSESSSVLLPAKSDRVGAILDTVGSSLADVDTVPKSIIDPEHGGEETAKNFLGSIGIEQVAPDWIAREKLLPDITAENRQENDQEIDVDTLRTYTGIVNAELDPEEFEQELLVIAPDQEVYPAGDVSLSPTFGAAYDTGSLLDDPIVSSAYQRGEYGDNWSSFFGAIGVQPETSPNAIRNALTNIPDLEIDATDEIQNVYSAITAETGAQIDTSEVQVLTRSEEFSSASEVYLPDNKESVRVFRDNHFVWLPDEEDTRDSAIEGLDALGLARASNEFKKEFQPGEQIEERVDLGAEKRIQECWSRMSEDITELRSNSPQITWIESVKIKYRLGENSVPEPAERRSYFEDDTLYLTRDFGHRWDDLAETLADNLDIDIDPEEISAKFTPTVEDAAISEVIQYESGRDRQAKDIRQDQTGHEGYDVLSEDPLSGEERHIEIKSFSSRGTAKFRPNQQAKAREDEDFYLYIVLDPQGDDPKIWFKQSPDVDQLLDRGAEMEQVLAVPRSVWEPYCDGPIPTRQT